MALMEFFFDLYTNLIILPNREVIRWAISDANYNGKAKVTTPVYFTWRSAFCKHKQPQTHTHMHTDSSQAAEITPAKHNHL